MIGLIFSALPGLLGKAADILAKRADVELQGFTAGTQADTERLKAYLSAQVETNKARASQRTGILGAVSSVIVACAGIPVALHFGAIYLDSTFRFGWGIAKVPAPYDGYGWGLLQTFFIVGPAVPVLGAAAGWLRRR